MAKHKDYIAAEHPQRGTLYAAWNPSLRFVAGGVRDSRFAARLAPFPDEASARLTLKQEGAKLTEPAR